MAAGSRALSTHGGNGVKENRVAERRLYSIAETRGPAPNHFFHFNSFSSDRAAQVSLRDMSIVAVVQSGLERPGYQHSAAPRRGSLPAGCAHHSFPVATAEPGA